MSLSVGVLLAVTAAAAAAETSYLLLHRTPSTSPAWSERAKIYLEPGSAPRYEEVTSKVPKIDAGDARGIYQLALVPADGNKKAVDDNTPMTFAKAVRPSHSSLVAQTGTDWPSLTVSLVCSPEREHHAAPRRIPTIGAWNQLRSHWA